MNLIKEDVQKAIDFLKTLAPNQFIANQQTLDFEPENIGKFHCVFGHLVLNPASPFHREGNAYNKSGFRFNSNVDMDYFPVVLCDKTHIHLINNLASDHERKNLVIIELEKFVKTL